MKTLLMTLAMVLVIVSSAGAADIPLEWGPIQNPAWGVVVFWDDDAPGPPYGFQAVAGINATAYLIEHAVPGKTYYIAAKCYDPASEELSDAYSNEVSYTVPAFVVPELLLPDMGTEVREYRLILRFEAAGGSE